MSWLHTAPSHLQFLWTSLLIHWALNNSCLMLCPAHCKINATFSPLLHCYDWLVVCWASESWLYLGFYNMLYLVKGTLSCHWVQLLGPGRSLFPNHPSVNLLAGHQPLHTFCTRGFMNFDHTSLTTCRCLFPQLALGPPGLTRCPPLLWWSWVPGMLTINLWFTQGGEAQIFSIPGTPNVAQIHPVRHCRK